MGGPGAKARAAARAEGPSPDDEPFGAPTAADVRSMKRRARASDDVHRQVYEQGQADERESAKGRRAPAGVRGPGRARRRSSGSRIRAPWNPPRRLSAGDGAGFLLGLIAYALGFAFLEGGPGGVTRWLRSKFFGEATSGPTVDPLNPRGDTRPGTTTPGADRALQPYPGAAPGPYDPRAGTPPAPTLPPYGSQSGARGEGGA